MTDPRIIADAILDHLRERYAAHAPLPRCDGLHVYPCEEIKTGICVCNHQDGYTLTLHQLRRLMRAVVGEFVEET